MIKKLLIMEKALELFAKQGVEATSIQQITEHCGISKGAFYLSFKSKDELILSLIDHFMKQITAEIDYTVKNSKEGELLYSFFSTIFHSFQNHSDFAKLLVKERSQSLNDDLLAKLRFYDSLTDKAIIEMVEKLYGDDVAQTKYDLVYTIKGLMSVYSSLALFNNTPLDVDLLACSLVEKADLLARHSTIPVITQQLNEIYPQAKMTKEKLLELLEKKIDEIDNKIEKESLILLRNHIIDPSLSPAIVKGLLENIRNHPHCKWTAYLLRNYFE